MSSVPSSYLAAASVATVAAVSRVTEKNLHHKHAAHVCLCVSRCVLHRGIMMDGRRAVFIRNVEIELHFHRIIMSYYV